MHIEVLLSKDRSQFCGNIDGKPFEFTVNEFINLIGAFQKAAYKVQELGEVPEEELVCTDNLKGNYEHN